jgi:uncharacterized protein YbbC (DUF1343 family)
MKAFSIQHAAFGIRPTVHHPLHVPLLPLGFLSAFFSIVLVSCVTPERPTEPVRPQVEVPTTTSAPEARTIQPPASGLKPPAVRTGIDVLEARKFAPLRGKRVGLITSASGVDRGLRSTADVFAGAEGVRLVALFAPEHGVRGALQAGASVGDGRDPRTGVPVHSLYGKTRKPTRELLDGIDVLAYDIQDVGARPYTFLSTLIGCMEAAAEAKIGFIVLDRPDPLGGEFLDGPVLEPAFESFVGPHEVPLRFGMTPGEFARMANAERKIGVKLEVVPLEGWRRGMGFRETGLPWVAPSPNIPTPETCLVFPGFVLLEATNLSEGRGTTRPFFLLGAPWLDADRVAADLNRSGVAGAIFRATEFAPCDSKHDGKTCGGIEVHVMDPGRFRPAEAAVAAIATIRRIHPKELKIDPRSFDRLAGCSWLREAIERGDGTAKIAARWTAGHDEFRARRSGYLMYR